MSGLDIGVTLASLAIIAALAFFFFGPKKARQAQVKGNVQEIHITVKGGYSPSVIRVREGVPLRLVFDRQEASDCSDRVVFPDFQASKSLAPFATTTLEFTPNKSGSFGFACGMNMLHGTLIVERDEAGSDGVDDPSVDHAAHVTFAQAVGVGPRMEVSSLANAEFSIIGGGVSCPTCVVNIESFLNDVPGVDEVHVNFAAERVTVQYDPAQASIENMRQVIQDAGYRIQSRDEPGTQETEDREVAVRKGGAPGPDQTGSPGSRPDDSCPVCHHGGRLHQQGLGSGPVGKLLVPAGVDLPGHGVHRLAHSPHRLADSNEAGRRHEQPDNYRHVGGLLL